MKWKVEKLHPVERSYVEASVTVEAATWMGAREQVIMLDGWPLDPNSEHIRCSQIDSTPKKR